MESARERTRLTARVVVTLSVIVAGFALTPAAANAAVDCDRYASINGSDANTGGTPATAFRSIRKLVPSLQPGEVGCLVGPNFTQGWDGFGQVVGGGGTEAAPVTITSAGATPTTYAGPLVLDAEVHDVKIQGLKFVGAPAPQGRDHGWSHIQVNGDRIQILDNDITDPLGICIGAGTTDTTVENDPDAIRADDLFIDGNRIHGCGEDIVNWGPGESGVHAVYIVNAVGTRITDNYIYDAINRGIQLYPHAVNTTVEHNVLDGNGANINMGSYAPTGYFTQNSIFRYNIVSNSALRSIYDPPPNFPPGDQAQVTGFYPSNTTPGQYGNVVTLNCLYQTDPTKNFTGYGYQQSDNTFADPMYVDRANKNFALEAGSPCSGYGPDGDAPPPEAVYKADMMIRRTGLSEAFRGDDIWNTTGAMQTRSVTASAGVWKTFDLKLQNDGDNADSFSFIGTGGAPGFRSRFFLDGVDITREVKQGTRSSGTLEPGASAQIQMRVKATQDAAPGSISTWRIHGVSFGAFQGGQDVRDVVRAKLRVAT